MDGALFKVDHMLTLVLFTIGFSISCGLFAYLYLSWLWVIGIGAFCCAVLLYFVAKKRIWIKAIATVLLGFAVAGGWTQLYSGVYLAAPAKLDTQIRDTTITVTDYSYETDYGIASEGVVFLENKPYFVKFYLNDQEELEPGFTVTGDFRFRLTTGTGIEDPTYHRSEGKFLLLYAKGDAAITRSDKAPWYCWPAVWRNMLLEDLEELFPGDTVGFVQALVLGERDKLDYETQTALKVSGIQHVVAVSGLHVSILFALLSALVLHKQTASLLVSVPVLFLFAAVVGFTPSVTRACIMLILILIAEVAFQDYDPSTALAFSALVMLTANPLAITSVSFQLSVGCTIGIIAFNSKINLWIQSRKWIGTFKGKGILPRLKRWCSSSVSVTLSAMIITTPFVAYYFGAVSLIGVLTNLLTLWCISFVFYGVVICCVFHAVGFGIAGFMASILSWLIRYVLLVAKLFSKIPIAAVYTESDYIVIWLVVCYVLLILFFLLKKKRPVMLFGCTAVMLFLAVFASWLEPRLYTTYATFLDVGQGQCIILQSGGHTFLVDCGGTRDAETADIAAETLLSRGISCIDGIIFTHYDRDHAGGASNFLSRISADYVYLPDIVDKYGIKSQLLETADERAFLINKDLDVLFGSGKLRIFASDAYDLGNESGICVLFQTENCDILITGDRGELGEMMLLHQHTLPKLEVLVAGHHGSAGATTERLLSASNPETVVISVGRNNPYGHPSDALLSRLMLTDCEILRTDLDGTIIYRR